MRRIVFCLMLAWVFGLAAQGADSLEFPQPQFMNPIFDSFTRNYVSTSAMGRGYTGVAIPGGVDNVLLNPASYAPDRGSLHLEMLIKPPTDINFYQEGTADGAFMTSGDQLTSPVPFGVISAGGKLGGNFTGGLLYSLPRTIHLDDFSIAMHGGAYLLMRYPTYNLHQVTANLAWHKGPFSAGINLHNQFHYFGDVTFMRTFERIRKTFYVPRPQLGLLWQGGKFNAGLSVTPPQNIEWDLKYAVYDTQLPLNAVLGATYKSGQARITAEVDFEQCSAISEAFKDRFTIRLGAEKTVRKFTYRAGYAFSPEVWHGAYKLPVNTTANADTALAWDDVNFGGEVEKNTQHLLSVGTTWHYKDGGINLALLMDVAGQAPVAQINLSADLYLSVFRRRTLPDFK